MRLFEYGKDERPKKIGRWPITYRDDYEISAEAETKGKADKVAPESNESGFIIPNHDLVEIMPLFDDDSALIVLINSELGGHVCRTAFREDDSEIRLSSGSYLLYGDAASPLVIDISKDLPGYWKRAHRLDFWQWFGTSAVYNLEKIVGKKTKRIGLVYALPLGYTKKQIAQASLLTEGLEITPQNVSHHQLCANDIPLVFIEEGSIFESKLFGTGYQYIVFEGVMRKFDDSTVNLKTPHVIDVASFFWEDSTTPATISFDPSEPPKNQELG